MAQAGCCASARRLISSAREPQRGGGHVVGQVVRVAGAGDGQHVRPALQRPGQPDLRGVAPWARATASTSACSGPVAPAPAAAPGDREERHERDALLARRRPANSSCLGGSRRRRTGSARRPPARWPGPRPGAAASRRTGPGAGSARRRAARPARRSARRSSPCPAARRKFTTSRWSRPSWRRFSSTWPRSWSGRAAVGHSPDGSRPGPTLVTMTRSSG